SSRRRHTRFSRDWSSDVCSSDLMPQFELVSDFQPTGDQPRAIDELVDGLNAGNRYQTLLGATGTGKTFTMAQVVQRVQRPTLVRSEERRVGKGRRARWARQRATT